MKIVQYSANDKKTWDGFVRSSKNGHFIFYRDYLEYHRDRFDDYSLLIYDTKDDLVALLPAHRKENHFASHNGLTYGGLVTNNSMKTPLMLNILQKTIDFLQNESFSTFSYKTIPYIHHVIPSDEDKYALLYCGASLHKRNLLAVRDQRESVPFQDRRNRGINKAKQNNLEVKESKDFTAFWKILSDLLKATHDSKPVHTLHEITLLANLFPDNIKLYACFSCTTMIAGVVIYESGNVARTQYIASNEEGKDLGALDLIFNQLIHQIYPNKRYIDFGTSEKPHLNELNIGLIEQKEGFGARAVAYDHYEIKL